MKINDFLCERERESAGGRIKAFQFISKFVYALFLQMVASASHCTPAPPLHCPRLAWPCSSTCHPSLKMATSDGGAGVWMCVGSPDLRLRYEALRLGLFPNERCAIKPGFIGLLPVLLSLHHPPPQSPYTYHHECQSGRSVQFRAQNNCT